MVLLFELSREHSCHGLQAPAQQNSETTRISRLVKRSGCSPSTCFSDVVRLDLPILLINSGVSWLVFAVWLSL